MKNANFSRLKLVKIAKNDIQLFRQSPSSTARQRSTTPSKRSMDVVSDFRNLRLGNFMENEQVRKSFIRIRNVG
jgi:hypothetical protein